MESITTGTLAGTGSFRCEECGYVVTLAAADSLPDCPGCGGSRFARASLFSSARFGRRPSDEPTPDERRELLARARVVHRGRTIAVGTCELLDRSGKPAAMASGTAVILPGRGWDRPVRVEEELPPD